MKTKTLRWLAAMLLLVAAMVIPARGNAEVTLTYIEGSPAVDNKESEAADKLFDGNTNTKWCFPIQPPSGGPAYVVFKASESCKLNGYKITTANDNDKYPGRNPKNWKIYGSNDKSTWTELVSVSEDKKLQAVNFTSYAYTLNPGIATSYMYYKWEITATHGDINGQVSEFSIFAADRAVDWSQIDWVKTDGQPGNALEYKYKVAIIPNDIPDDISNKVTLGTIQKPTWASSKAGIHIIFPSDLAFGEIRINGIKGVEMENYAKDGGAGVCLYLSNFTEELTEVQVMDPENNSIIKWTLYVYYVKPVMVSASKKYVTLDAAVLNVAGTENANGYPVTRFRVVETGTTYTATDGKIKIEDLERNKTYTFTISAVDSVGNVSDNTIPVEVTTLSLPAPAPAPTHEPVQVFSIYSDAYTSTITRTMGGWGQQTKEQELALAEGDNAFYYTDCNYLGWELNNNNNNNNIGDMNNFPKLHMDIYVPEAGTIKFSPVWRGVNGSEEELKEYSLKQGWNALNIDLTKDFAGINLENIFQLKWYDMPAVCFIDNVYFWVEFFIIYHGDVLPDDAEKGAVTEYKGGRILQPIRYKRKFKPGVWETLCVPFVVDSITVTDNDGTYPLYAQYDHDNNPNTTSVSGHFWLREFRENSVCAEDFQGNWYDIPVANEQAALPQKNKPYIMRVPEDDGYYKDKYIVFHGAGGQEIAKTYTAPDLPADGYFSYSGNNTMMPWKLENAYVLDAEGEYFYADKPVTLRPFECAVNATQATIRLYSRLMMSSPQIPTDHGLPSTEYEGGRIYTTMGVLVGTFETLDEEENCVMHLPEGIYIVQRRQAISKIHISK